MQIWEHFEPKLQAFIANEMEVDLAHDLNHVKRVVNSAKFLANRESADLNIVIPAAYLHDCINLPKTHPDRSKASIHAADKAVKFLASIQYPSQYLVPIHEAISAHSYSANINANSLEAKIVQDADRLDAIGAIGIARCLQVSAAFKTPLYHAHDPFCETRTPNDKEFTLDHFYVKLFRICDTLHTDAAKAEGLLRKQYMESFMLQLKSEM